MPCEQKPTGMSAMRSISTLFLRQRALLALANFWTLACFRAIQWVCMWGKRSKVRRVASVLHESVVRTLIPTSFICVTVKVHKEMYLGAEIMHHQWLFWRWKGEGGTADLCLSALSIVWKMNILFSILLQIAEIVFGAEAVMLKFCYTQVAVSATAYL